MARTHRVAYLAHDGERGHYEPRGFDEARKQRNELRSMYPHNDYWVEPVPKSEEKRRKVSSSYGSIGSGHPDFFDH